MIVKLKSVVLTALSVVGLASACAVDSGAGEQTEWDEAAVCWNESGTNAAMASLAVATAMELRRWKPTTDFYVAWDWTLQLTTEGKNRCWDKTCKNVQAILDWQKPIYGGGKVRFPGGDQLNPDVFKSRLLSRFDQQKTCESRNYPHNCWAEDHDLSFVRAAPGSCDTNYFFHAYKAGTTQNLQHPGQLKYKLLWAGWDPAVGTENPYIAFDVQGDDVQIDPTAGVISGDPQASGSCPVVCSKFSMTNISNSCCVCNGAQGKMQYAVAPPTGNPYMFSCR